MEAINTLVKVSLPAYLKKLPIPKTFEGFSTLTGEEWLALLPFVALVIFLFYATLKIFLPASRPPPIINPTIKKENPKVVDLVEIEDFDKEKVAYCRCWKSEKFPLCDGAHNKHNETTGDNIGPVILKKKQKA